MILNKILTFKFLILLNALDVISTYVGIEYIRLTERNPIALAGFEQFGMIPYMTGMKIIGLILIYLCIRIIPYISVRKTALYLCVLVFVVVVSNNIFWMVRYAL